MYRWVIKSYVIPKNLMFKSEEGKVMKDSKGNKEGRKNGGTEYRTERRNWFAVYKPSVIFLVLTRTIRTM